MKNIEKKYDDTFGAPGKIYAAEWNSVVDELKTALGPDAIFDENNTGQLAEVLQSIRASVSTSDGLKIDKTDIVSTLTSTDDSKVLAASKGKELKDLIDGILLTLTSDDTSLDQLQELVTFIKDNKGTLESLSIVNVTGLQSALDLKSNTTHTHDDRYFTEGELNSKLSGKVDDSQVLTDVPSGAKFTDTVYTKPSSEAISYITGLQTALEAKVAKVSGKDLINTTEHSNLLQDVRNLKTLLLSNDTTVDTLQEVVNFIKANKSTLDALSIPNISGLEASLAGKSNTNHDHNGVYLPLHSKADDSAHFDGKASAVFARTDIKEEFTESIGVGILPGGLIDNGKGIALGDGDSGIRQDGDGVIEIVSNNQAAIRVEPGKMLFRNSLTIDNNGKLYNTSTTKRSAGVYGVYDVGLTSHIWSMGTSYAIPDDGSDFGNLYGLAYCYNAHGNGDVMGGSHQAIWCISGTPTVALGDHIWAKNDALIGRDVKAKGHISTEKNLYVSGITNLSGTVNIAGKRAYDEYGQLKHVARAYDNTLDPNAIEGIANILTKHANCPNSSDYWYISTVNFNTDTSGFKTQTAKPFNTTAKHDMYTRNSYNEIWSPWAKVPTIKNLDTHVPQIMRVFQVNSAQTNHWFKIANIKNLISETVTLDFSCRQGYEASDTEGGGRIYIQTTDSDVPSLSGWFDRDLSFQDIGIVENSHTDYDVYVQARVYQHMTVTVSQSNENSTTLFYNEYSSTTTPPGLISKMSFMKTMATTEDVSTATDKQRNYVAMENANNVWQSAYDYEIEVQAKTNSQENTTVYLYVKLKNTLNDNSLTLHYIGIDNVSSHAMCAGTMTIPANHEFLIYSNAGLEQANKLIRI